MAGGKYKDLIIDAVGREDWFDLPKSEKLQKTKEMGIEVDPELEDFEVTNDVFEKMIEHTLVQPTFVTHIPKELCPLAKITKSDPSTIDVFELCINGQEIALHIPSKTILQYNGMPFFVKWAKRPMNWTTIFCSHLNTVCHRLEVWEWELTGWSFF